MFTRIIDFIQCQGQQIEVQIVRSPTGTVTYGFFGPGFERVAPIEGLGQFDTSEQALNAAKQWVARWAAKAYG